MTVGMNEYNKLVYATAKVAIKFCSHKRKKVNATKKPSWKQKIKEGIEHVWGELSIVNELERYINMKVKICRKLKKKYKLNKENMNNNKETVKHRIQFKAQRMPWCEKQGKFYHQNFIFKNNGKKFCREKVIVNETPAVNNNERLW